MTLSFWEWTADAQELHLTFNSVHLNSAHQQVSLSFQLDLIDKDRQVVPWPCLLCSGEPDPPGIVGHSLGCVLEVGAKLQ